MDELIEGLLSRARRPSPEDEKKALRKKRIRKAVKIAAAVGLTAAAGLGYRHHLKGQVKRGEKDYETRLRIFEPDLAKEVFGESDDDRRRRRQDLVLSIGKIGAENPDAVAQFIRGTVKVGHGAYQGATKAYYKVPKEKRKKFWSQVGRGVKGAAILAAIGGAGVLAHKGHKEAQRRAQGRGWAQGLEKTTKHQAASGSWSDETYGGRLEGVRKSKS